MALSKVPRTIEGQTSARAHGFWTITVINIDTQPVGQALPHWQPASPPPRRPMQGRLCRLEPLDPDRHGGDLFAAFSQDRDHRNWTYLPYGPFATEAAFLDWLAAEGTGDDPLFHAILDEDTSRAVGLASYLRIEPAFGVIETGHIHYSPLLQRRPAATEAMMLMMQRVFSDLGYRRYEWKCDALNASSRRAAERLGFRFEGVFRQATIYKGRNRDTAWYSVLDSEWPALEAIFARWLDPANFGPSGRQKVSLTTLMANRDDAGTPSTDRGQPSTPA